MHPILFEVGSFTIYTYGFCIAIGALTGLSYMTWQGKKQFNLSFDTTNSLFIFIVVAAIVGGKSFFFFEDPAYYSKNIVRLFKGSGFVFYGSFLFAVPVMLWFFKRHKIPTLAMLDIMALVTCIVHGFGRVGCFMAGCCYGKPTDSIFGVTFTNPVCQAEPLNTALHPTQLYESGFIFCLLVVLALLKSRKQFDGQLFLLYLILYAAGRAVLEIFRGDVARGFVIKDWLSHSQFISIIIIVVAGICYFRLSNKKGIWKTKASAKK
ncbi:MAG: prolipoprotein diacylglyceryl transferase [Bacteroidota bacterium]